MHLQELSELIDQVRGNIDAIHGMHHRAFHSTHNLIMSSPITLEQRGIHDAQQSPYLHLAITDIQDWPVQTLEAIQCMQQATLLHLHGCHECIGVLCQST